MTNWKDTYQPITQAIAENTTLVKLDDDTLIARGMVLDIREVLGLINPGKEKDWKTLYIFTDVLLVPDSAKAPKHTSIDLRGTQAFVFARRIQSPQDNGRCVFVNYNQAMSCPIQIFSQESNCICSLILINYENSPATSLAVTAGAIGVEAKLEGNKLNHYPINQVPKSDLINEHLFWQLQLTFTCAMSLFYSGKPSKNLALPTKLFQWIAQVAKHGSGELGNLALQSAHMVLACGEASQPYSPIPLLSQSVYDLLANSWLSQAQGMEEAYLRISDKEDANQENQKAASLALKHYKNNQEVVDNLIDNRTKALSAAIAVLASSVETLRQQQAQVATARQTFNAGVDKFEEEKKKQALLDAFKAVMEVATAVGSMVATDGASAPAAASAVSSAETAITKVVEVTSTLDRLKKVFDTLKKIKDVFEKIQSILEPLKKLVDALQNLKSTSADDQRSLIENLQLRPSGEKGKSTILDNTYWDVFSLRAADAFEPYTAGENQIDGAAELLEALKIMAIYGKAVYQRQTAIVKIRQELLKLLVQKNGVTKDVAATQAYIDDEKNIYENLVKLKSRLYAQLMHVKGAVAMATFHRIDAFKYWALSSDISDKYYPLLSDNVEEIHRCLASIDQARGEAMKKFTPTPQGPIQKQFTLKTPALLNEIKTKKSCTLSVLTILQKATNPLPPNIVMDFIEEFDRVRISSVEVYVNNEAIKAKDQQVTINMKTNGCYADKFKGELFHFIGDTFKRTFEYKVNATESRTIIAAATVPVEFNDSYFKPTPYSSWTFDFSYHDNDSVIDYNKLTKVEILFTVEGNSSIAEK